MCLAVSPPRVLLLAHGYLSPSALGTVFSWSTWAPSASCRSFTLQSLEEVEGRCHAALLETPQRAEAVLGSVQGFVPHSCHWRKGALPRSLPNLGGASGCSSTDLLVVFP